jgi:hypothetical protein
MRNAAATPSNERNGVGWVERSDTHLLAGLLLEVVGFTSFNPSCVPLFAV